MSEFIMGTKWVSLNKFRVDWNAYSDHEKGNGWNIAGKVIELSEFTMVLNEKVVNISQKLAYGRKVVNISNENVGLSFS